MMKKVALLLLLSGMALMGCNSAENQSAGTDMPEHDFWTPNIGQEGFWKYQWNGTDLKGEQGTEAWLEYFDALGFRKIVEGHLENINLVGDGEALVIEEKSTGNSKRIEFSEIPLIYATVESGFTTLYLPCGNGTSLDYMWEKGATIQFSMLPNALGSSSRVAIDGEGAGSALSVIGIIKDPAQARPAVDFSGDWDSQTERAATEVIMTDPASCDGFTETVLSVTASTVNIMVCGEVLYLVENGSECKGALLISNTECGFCITRTESGGQVTLEIKSTPECAGKLKMGC